MLIKASPKPAAHLEGKGSCQCSRAREASRRQPSLHGCRAGEHAGLAAHPTFPRFPSRSGSWPLQGILSGLLPPCSCSLTITSFTAQLQVHSHQEVFPLSHFSLHPLSVAIFGSCNITLYILYQGEREIPEAIFWCILLSVLENSCRRYMIICPVSAL